MSGARKTRPRTVPAEGERQLRVFAGKGGVGKTTCAAAAAVSWADAGQRVLVVSTDPAHSLGDLLGERLRATGTGLRPRRRGVCDAVELDADRALARWITQRRDALRRIVSRGTYLDDDDIDSLLRLAFPGVDELIGLVELTRLAERRPYDVVVVDTAPTGHALRLLAMPATLSRIAEVLDDMQAKHRFLAESLGGRYRPDVADALVNEIGAEGRDLAALLRDPARTCVAWVVLPEALSLEEARDGVAALEASGMRVGEIVVNRVTPPPRGACGFCARRVAAERAVIEEIGRSFGGRPVRVVPALEAEPRGLGALRGLGRRLLAPPARERPAAGAGLDAPPGLASGRVRSPSAGVASAPAHRGPGSESESWLAVLAPAGRRLLLFAGKGGVGKTTCATSVALAIAARPSAPRVLLMSTDPAHSLGDVLGVPVGDEARTVPGGPPGLRIREIDAGRLFAARRERYRQNVDDVFTALRGGSRFDPTYDRVVMEDLIDLAPPGIDELFGLLCAVDALTAGDATASDLVVVDTAPTGHTLRLLEMPRAALAWVRAFMAILLKYRTVIGLGELGADLVAVSRDLRALEALLMDATRTAVVAATRAAELPRLETRRLLARVRTLHVTVAGVIVNALTPRGCARCRRASVEEARVRRKIAADVRARAPRGCAIIEAPATAPPPRGAVALAAWRLTWAAARP